MHVKSIAFGPLGREACKEAIEIVEIIIKAGLTVSQARFVLRDVETIIEESPVLAPYLLEESEALREKELQSIIQSVLGSHHNS